MAFKLLRYREWLAISAAVLSMALLAESGDYLYNVMNWTAIARQLIGGLPARLVTRSAKEL